MAECELYRHIIDFLNLRGFYAFRASTGGRGRYRFGLKGQADISGICPDGRRLEIEVKSENGKLSDEQKAFLEEMIRHGALVMVVKGWNDFISQFDSIGEKSYSIIGKKG
jgi:hypothetical protein